MIYFDNGASSHPKPQRVIKAVGEWMRKNGSNPGRSGHRLSMEAAEVIYNTRLEIGKLFGVDKAENVVLVPNATYALNTVLLGLFEKGDHIITTDLEHNSVLRPLWHLEKNGVDVTVVPVDFADDDRFVARVIGAVRKNTKAIVCTQCSNICGKIMPLDLLSAHKPADILLIVDGAQGAGTIPIDVVRGKVDYYCAPSHKGLLGPQGGGVILVNNRIPRPLVFGGTGTESMNLDQPESLPEHLESGTLPTAICAGMLAGVQYIRRIGIEEIYRHKRKLTQYAYSALSEVDGIELYMFPYAEKCVGVVPFNVKKFHSGEVISYLDKNGVCARGGIHCAPLFHKRMGTDHRGMVRISFGYSNTLAEIEKMANLLKKI